MPYIFMGVIVVAYIAFRCILWDGVIDFSRNKIKGGDKG